MNPSIKIPDWDALGGHYKYRNPPWVRLYRSFVLDNPAWVNLSDKAARLLVELWVLASEEQPGGSIYLDLEMLAFRLRHASTMLAFAEALQELGDKGLVEFSDGFASMVPTARTARGRPRIETRH